jgi:cell division septal protein FtsQ
MAKVLPVLVLVIFTLVAVFFYQILKIKDAEIVQNKDCVNSQNVLGDLQLEGQNIFFVSTQKLTADLKNKYACADDAKIEKKFPSKRIINIKVKQPIARIEGANLVVLESGQVEESKNDKDKPIIYLPGNLKPQLGQKIIDQNILFALKITASLLKSDFIPANIRLLPPTDVAVYDNQAVVALFSTQKGPDAQVDSLQQVLAASKIYATKITKIDLRFDKPIIVYR